MGGKPQALFALISSGETKQCIFDHFSAALLPPNPLILWGGGWMSFLHLIRSALAEHWR